MKKTLLYSLLIILVAGLYSCDKDTEDISTITYYPILTMEGDQFMTIQAGNAYVEPGVGVMIGETAVDPTIEGTVDASTPGVYTLTYSATNEDGYSASIKRFVGVIAADAWTNDFSGEYQRTAYGSSVGPAGVAAWTKVAGGLYTNNNVGGVPGDDSYVYDVYVFNVSGNKIMVPVQPNQRGGDMHCSSSKAGSSDLIDFVSGSAGTESYKWSVVGSGYGTNLRTFTKL